MFDWLQNPRAEYVLAAYGAAAVALIGLLIASFRAFRKKRRKAEKLRGTHADISA